MRRRWRRLRFTREGKYFVALCLGIGFAAINTGNNLLYLILGMMLALIVGSGVLSELSLRRLRVRRRPPGRIFAGQPFLVGISLTNDKHRLPSFSVEIEDLLAQAPIDKKCYFLKVPAGRTQQTSYRHTLPRRGAYELTGLRLSTKFPFALFQKSRTLRSSGELLVYPAISPLLAAPALPARDGRGQPHRRGRRGDFHALREFRQGDDPRDISWRKSAAFGRKLVREHEDPSGQRVTIFLDNRAVAQLSPADIDRQEEAVSRAGSLAAHYLERGYLVGLQTHTSSVAPGGGDRQLDRILRVLALLEFVETSAHARVRSSGRGEMIDIRPERSAQRVTVTPRALG